VATIIGQTRKPFGRPAYQYVRTTDNLPSTDAVAAIDDPVCKVKLFAPNATWYIAGFDPETGLAFGVADIFYAEVGDFDVNELVALRTRPFGLPVERDLYWVPAPISAVLAGTVR
jgi:hypothetical protein